MTEFFGCMWIACAACAALLVVIVVVETREMRKARSWPSTMGKVIANRVQVRKQQAFSNPADTEVVNNPRVEYEYVVSGRTYRGARITIGEQPTHLELEDTLARYPVGAAVTVYYDPADPHMAALERELPWWMWKVFGWMLLILLGGPPLAWLLLPLLYFNAVAWLRPQLANPSSAEFVAVLIGIGLVVVLLAIGCTGIVWQAGRWPVTRGRIVSSGVGAFQFSSAGGEDSSSTRYKPSVVYTYEVNGRQYSSDRVNYGLLASGMSQSYAKGIAGKYKVGSEVTVYYNPKNPGDSLLNPHARWHYFPWLVAACIFALVWAIATGRLR